jgi:hypothetical protein
MFLTDDELVQLTRRTRRASQRQVLAAMGIEHRPRPDGSLVVLRSHVEKLLDGALANAKIRVQNNEPDWSKV